MTPTDWVALYLSEHLPPEALEADLPSEALTAVVDALKQAADDHWYKAPERSLMYAERIVGLGNHHQHPSHTALGHMARGDALKFMGQMNEAWQALELAGELFLSADNKVGWARTRIGRLYVGVQLKRAAEALADVELAAAILTAANLPDRLMRLHLQTAYVLNYLGEHQQAIKLLQEQIEKVPSLGEEGQKLLGVLYINLGSTYLNCGELAAALQCFEQARALAELKQETLNLALIEADIANVYRLQGRHRRALLTLERGLQYAAADAGYSATLQQDLVECYLQLNRYPEAREVALAACQSLRTQQKNYELARTLVYLANAEMTLNHMAEAQRALDEAEAIFNELNTKVGQIQIHLWRGHLALRQGQYAQAQFSAECAIQLAGEQRQHTHLAYARLLWGQAALKEQALAEAAQTATASLTFARQQNIPALRYAAHVLLGQVAEAQTRWGRASRHYQAAEAVLERQQRHLTLTLRTEYLVDKDEAFRALIALQLRRGQAEAAWLTLERAKSQNWLGYLSHQDQLRWQTSDAHSARLLAELERLRGEHQWLAQQAQAEPIDSAPARTRQEILEHERRIRAITEKLYLHNEQGEQYDPAPVASLHDIRRTLDERTVLIEYYGDADQLWAFVLGSQTFQVHALPTPLETLTRWQQNLHFSLRSLLTLERTSTTHHALAQQTLRLLQKLHAALFAPLNLSAVEHSALTIVPYSLWHLFPFHLLYDGQNFLFEQFELSGLPAASLRLLAAPRRRPGALVLSHSAGGRLPHTRAEAEMVQKQWGGQWLDEAAATRAAFGQPPVQILHVAAHGHYRPDQPTLSFVELADGQLYADDLFQHDLSYELVTLSACETGRVNAQGRDELIGLGRGFLFAGAGALLQSLWQVPDDTTVALMQAFYRELQSGAPKPVALQQAQRQQLQASGPARLADWGAFQLIGNPAPLSVAQ